MTWAARLAWLLVGVILGAAVSYLNAKEIIVDPRMPTMCLWPRHNGEAMMVAIVDGKVRCWELNR